MFGRTQKSRRRSTVSARRLDLESLEDRCLLSFFGNSLFPADNPWNQKIASAPVAANSATLVNSIGSTRGVHADFGAAIYEGAAIGFPITVVNSSQPRINVIIDAYDDESDLVPIPLPANAAIEGDPLPSAQNTGDRHVLVYDRDNNVGYETFFTHRPSETADGKWHADAESVWDYKTNSFRTPGFTSADAAGLPILPGLVRADEVLDQGRIDHAIRFTVPRSASAFVFPASHQAGSNNAALPRMGERFRLKQSFDISGYSAANRVILQAMKDYGLIVADNGSGWYISGEHSSRWNDDDLHNLGRIKGSDFEAVDLTPVVVSMGASSGPTTGGTTLIVNGLNFTGAAGRLQVFFGTTVASSVTIVSDSQLRVTVPAHAAGSVDVSVKTPYGTSALTSGTRFTFGTTTPPATPPPTTPAPPTLTANQRFVTQAYLDVLRRAVDSSGLANWTAALDRGTTRGSVVAAITSSLEYRTLIVQDVYQGMLGRSAESGGLTNWVRFLGDGGTVEQLAAAVIGSDEFYRRSGSTTTAFVQSVYQAVFHRAADPDGARSWGNAVNAGRSRQEVAFAILGSMEARRLQVNDLYQRYLRRPADPTGLSNFATALQRGMRQEQVVAALVGSDEYFGRV